MPQWTKDQKDAIEMKGSNILVSAAAGSGKTAVLVERIIGLITKDEIDINRLLIVTFTNAAAGEMRERILKALTNEIEKGSEKEEHLRKQINLLSRSYIMTLHSFCIDIVRRNFHHIDIDPSFRIGDGTELGIMVEEVLEELLEDEYEKGEKEFINLVEGYGGNRDDLKLQELIYRIYSFVQSKPNPLEWLKESIEDFNMSKEELEESPWINTIKNSIKLELHGSQDLINTSIKLCSTADGPSEYIEALEGDSNNIKELLDILDKSFSSFNDAINKISHPKFKSIKGERKAQINENIQDEVKELRQKYKDTLTKSIKDKIFVLSIDEYVKQINSMYPTMNYLYKLVSRFAELYQDKKMDKGIVDFNDLEHLALRILSNEDIQKEYREKFEYIFIDEYQDSNIVQETIINYVKKHNNVFLVGDVKQSIYRFRLADPTLFIEKFESFSKDAGIDRRIDLSQNFRTRGEILESINYLFKNIMTKTLGEIHYNEDTFLYKGMEFGDIENPEIELDIIENDAEGIEELEEELQEMSSVEVEARLVANKIKSLIGKNTFNAKKGEYQKIEFKDIVVLLRSPKNWVNTFTEVFTREGIPVYADDGAGYFNSIEINMFLDLLRIVDNKRQDIPLLSVMRSPIGGFDVGELIKIRLYNRSASFYDSLDTYDKENSDDLAIKINSFLNDIEKWTKEARIMKLDEFIWKLLIETGYYHYVGAMPGGIQRQANLRILVDRASSFEKSAINGLFLFLRFIDKLTKTKGDMGTAKTLSENENVVRIMSIHKSKGLEFPVVFCCGLGKQFNLMDAREDILLHKDLGLGPKFVDIEKRTYFQSLPQIAIQKKIKLENLSEEMRILYVALTRAIDKLILVGSTKDISSRCKTWSRGTSVYNLSKGKSFLDWICCALIKHKDGEPLRLLSQIAIDEEVEEDNALWKINIFDRSNILMEENKNIQSQKEIKNQLLNFQLDTDNYLEEINRRFSWEYDHKGAVQLPSKLAVSDIKKASIMGVDNILYKIPALIKKPKFIEGIKPFNKAEIGTIIHFVMQHLDLQSVSTAEEINYQIKRMIDRELLTDEEAVVVDTTKLQSFFKSDIGQRMIKAPKVNREVSFVLKQKACNVIEGLEECGEDVLIQGIIDCYIEEDEGIILMDYKTGNVTTSNDIKEIVKRYKVQMDLYKQALEEITEKKVIESYIYLFDIDQAIKL